MQYLETMKAILPLVLLFLSTTMLAQNIPSIEQVEAELEEIKKKDDLRAYTLELARQRDSLIQTLNGNVTSLENNLTNTLTTLNYFQAEILRATDTISELKKSINSLSVEKEKLAEQHQNIVDSLTLTLDAMRNEQEQSSLQNHPIEIALRECLDTTFQMIPMKFCFDERYSKWENEIDSLLNELDTARYPSLADEQRAWEQYRNASSAMYVELTHDPRYEFQGSLAGLSWRSFISRFPLERYIELKGYLKRKNDCPGEDCF